MAELKPTGRNLLRNTDYTNGNAWWSRSNATSVSVGMIENEKVLKIDPNTDTQNRGFGISAADLLPSLDYCFSGKVYNDADTDIKVYIQVWYNNSGWEGVKFSTLNAKPGWNEFELTFKSNGQYEHHILGVGANKPNIIYLKEAKLELGTEATPWTPAPEDSLSGGGTNMILAFDVITLATVTDVQGIYRFYQLATSKPSKPTTYPPASAWSDEMPGYQLGNQDSLYFVDVTVFNDLTYQYGDVQLSTDYEAVKATYADALQQIANAEKQMQSEIQKTSESIRTEVSEDYYKKDQTDDLLGTISTALEQTKDSFTMQFNSFQADLENVNADNSAKFQELYQYIRFKGGSIELGETGNTITLTIENDRISFKQAGQEIAYMSNNQLYITDANIVTSLRIGNFIFSPRPNGSLDFKKVGA